MLALLSRLPIEGRKVLMMLPRRDENLVLSVRNIPTAKVQHVSSINVVELLKHDCLVMPRQTVRWIELVFGEGLSAEEASQQIDDQLASEIVSDAQELEASEGEPGEANDEETGVVQEEAVSDSSETHGEEEE